MDPAPNPTLRKNRLAKLFADLLETLTEIATVFGIFIDRAPDEEEDDDVDGMKPERTQ